MKITKTLWKSMELRENPWTSEKNNEHSWKSIKICKQLWKSMSMYGIYSIWKKMMGYISYSKEINPSHICRLKKNKQFKQINKIMVFGRTWTLTCKMPIKVMICLRTWNDSTVITDILPHPVSHKTTTKVYLLTKGLKSIFSKVWDSFPRQYLIV